MSQQTEAVLNEQRQSIAYAAERQSIGNQLELASMVSDPASVMGQSPVRSNRIGSRRTKDRIEQQ